MFSVEQHIYNLLVDRATAKIAFPNNIDALVRDAIWALADSPCSWGDSVRVHAKIKSSRKNQVEVRRCARLLHGVPSPRYWPWDSGYGGSVNVDFAALDVFYFFTNSSNRLQALLCSTPLKPMLPDFGSKEELADWIGQFSPRRFDERLVQALVDQVDDKLNNLGAVAVYAVEIDRFAWFKGYSSISVAKAAQVWTPH